MSKSLKSKYLLYDSQLVENSSSGKDFKSLYLKYKNKYINLKKQYGGLITCEELSQVGLNNYNGTCWNIVIQTIFFFSDKTRDEVQRKLLFTSTELVNNAKKNLELFLPNDLLDECNELLPSTYGMLVQIIDELKKRFNIKERDNIEKEPPPLLRQESRVCEGNFARKFFSLFNIKRGPKQSLGGGNTERFFLANLLSIIFLNCFINFESYSFINPRNKPNDEDFKEINLDLLNDSIGVYIRVNSDLLKEVEGGHAQGFFKCEGVMKFVNNNIIINYNYESLITKINQYRREKRSFSTLIDDIRGPYIIVFNKDDHTKIYFEPAYEEIKIDGRMVSINPEEYRIDNIIILNRVPIDNNFFKDKLSIYQNIDKKYTNFLVKTGMNFDTIFNSTTLK